MAPVFYWAGSRSERAVRCLREEWRTHFGTIQKWWAAIRGGREPGLSGCNSSWNACTYSTG